MEKGIRRSGIPLGSHFRGTPFARIGSQRETISMFKFYAIFRRYGLFGLLGYYGWTHRQQIVDYLNRHYGRRAHGRVDRRASEASFNDQRAA